MIMNITNEKHSIFGNTLFVEYGKIKLGIALEYGIRISHLSYDNSENLFFEQPACMKELSTPDGWRVRGGHRLWIAPESKDVYYPDNDAVSCDVKENTIIICQKNDPWLEIEKSIEIVFLSENSVKVIHKIKNTASKLRRCSLWGISSMAGGGTEQISLDVREGGYDPLHKITMWDYTSLGDERAVYERDLITLTHYPTSKKYKIGVGHPKGNVRYINKGVVFEKCYEINKNEEYPDGDVSFETFMCDHMVEIESLSPLYDIKPGESASHTEIWKLQNA